MTGVFDAVLLAEAGLVVVAGLIVLYTVAAYRESILYPSAIGLLGGSLLVIGLGIACAVVVEPGSGVALGLISVAGLGFCLAGWRISTDLLDTEEHLRIEPAPPVEQGGFAGDR